MCLYVYIFINVFISELKNSKNRDAQFKTVVALCSHGETKIFTGICKGHITKTKQGKKGFGYDPIFKPEGYQNTFAQMELSLKNSIGHRGKAIAQLVSFLSQ